MDLFHRYHSHLDVEIAINSKNVKKGSFLRPVFQMNKKKIVKHIKHRRVHSLSFGIFNTRCHLYKLLHLA